MEMEQAKKLVLMLVAYYETWKPTEETLTLYQNLLLPFEPRITEAVVMKLMRTSDNAFVPKVGVIAREIAKATLEAKNQATPSAEEAWTLVCERMRGRGYYQGLGYVSPAIQRAVNAIGWPALCASENIAADRAHFMRVYEAFRERAIEEEVRELTGSVGLAQLARDTIIQLPEPE